MARSEGHSKGCLWQLAATVVPAIQIQGRYGSNRMIEGLKASLEGVAISGRLLGPSTKPDGTLKFLKIEIAPTTEKKFFSVLVDGKEVNPNVTTPQYAIEFGRVPSVQHYEADKYFLDYNSAAGYFLVKNLMESLLG